MGPTALNPLHRLVQVFAEVPDPRAKRGVRHPYVSILGLVFLGLLARIRELAQLQFWADEHWDPLREPLGFTTPHPPHATTISRALARFSCEDFQDAFRCWLLVAAQRLEDLGVVAVDGKTCCQGQGADAQPIHVLSVFCHRLKVVLAQWEMHAEQTNEPQLLFRHLQELLADYPLLRLITGDAIYAQRNLAELVTSEECDYLLQVKGNQGELHQALQQTFVTKETRQPNAEVGEKKEGAGKLVACGATWTMPTTAERNWGSPHAASPSAWSVWSQPKTNRLLVVM